MKRIILCIVALTAATTANAAKPLKWLCIEEHSGGIAYNERNNEWVGGRFKAAEKYIVRPTRASVEGDAIPAENLEYGVYKHGSSYMEFLCYPSMNSSTDLSCSTKNGRFMMSREHMRFLYTYTAGYWDGTTDTPNMTVGQCSPL